MRRIDSPTQALERDTVVTVGVFDGVHLGHKGVLQELLSAAKDHAAEPAVLTFATHPDGLVAGSSPPLLVSLDHRLQLLAREGVQVALVLPFDEALRALDAGRFARTILAERLRCRCLVMGFDSALGRNREGTLPVLRELGRGLGFTVRSAPPLLWQGQPVSSSTIRAAVEAGDLGRAWALLGRPFSCLGAVLPGEGRGRELGFPTANLETEGRVLPPRGVYAAEAYLAGLRWPAVLNLGTGPTFGGGRLRLEVHLIGYAGPDFRGSALEVLFHARLRSERSFPDARTLILQIRQDVEAAAALLARGARGMVDSPGAPPTMRASGGISGPL